MEVRIVSENITISDVRSSFSKMNLGDLNVKEFGKRLLVLPGLTGVAQIYLSRHCHPRQRLAYDLIYLRRNNMWVDVKLMVLAAVNTLAGKWGTGHRKSGF